MQLTIRLIFRTLILYAALFLSTDVCGQGWQQFVGNQGDQRAFNINKLQDGRLVAFGSNIDSSGGQSDLFWAALDTMGLVLSVNTLGAPDSAESAVALLQADSQWLVLGNVANGTGTTHEIKWYQIDLQGNIMSVTGNQGVNALANGAIPFMNGYLVLGANYLPSGSDLFPQPYWLLIGEDGSLQWAVSNPVPKYGEAIDAVALGNGHAVVLAKELKTDLLQGVILFKVDSMGAVMAEMRLPAAENQVPASIAGFSGQDLVVVGDIGATLYERDILVQFIDSQTLQTDSSKRLLLPGAQIPHAAKKRPDGQLVIVGEHIPVGANSRDAFMALLDTAGKLLWFKTFGGLKGDIFWDVVADDSGGGFFIAGQSASFSPSGDLQAWLLRTDAQGKVWSNRVAGRVVRDLVQNCVPDSLEGGLPNWLVTASGANGASVYTLSDAQGAYSMELDTGAWHLSTLPPSDYWMPCEDSIQLTFNQLGDTLSLDFPTQTLYECPLLSVDLAIPYLRRCFENNLYVHYFNYGTAAAADAVIKVSLDPFLHVTGASLPYSQVMDTLVFQIGQVPALSGGDFSIQATLDCEGTVLGQSHCSTASITPDSICSAFNPDWDGSNLEVDGNCAGDSVVLTVTNTGAGMQSTVGFIITEDQIIFRNALLQLQSGQDTTFVLYPNGATVTIIVMQSPGHPGNSQPMLVVEGCGAGLFSTGYALQFPQNDGDPYTDIECRQNIGSFDPNDKSGLPLGVTAQGIVSPGTKIEYLIRFQNTGTDTAFRVEIRDKLDKTLDISSFREGASSHPYQLSFDEEGALRFLFEPIVLPDSSDNWEASQGFVKFSINTHAGAHTGAEILNTADIYFDSNSKVSTNTTSHEIGNPFEYLTTRLFEPENVGSGLAPLLIYPNPARTALDLNFQQPVNAEKLHVTVRDVVGRVCCTPRFWEYKNNSTMRMGVLGLPAGTYLIEVRSEHGELVGHGRFVKI